MRWLFHAPRILTKDSAYIKMNLVMFNGPHTILSNAFIINCKGIWSEFGHSMQYYEVVHLVQKVPPDLFVVVELLYGNTREFNTIPTSSTSKIMISM